jgi:nucleotide-binding universal stress UspA family protein
MASFGNRVTLNDMSTAATQHAIGSDSAVHKILVAYDGGAAADGALWLGALLARQGGASLTVVSVYAAEPAFHAHTDHLRLVLAAAADDHLERAERRLPYGFKAERRAIRSHSVPNALHDLAADEPVDVIVVGGKRQSRAHATLTGSVAERLVAAAARCAVAVVPRGTADRANAGLRLVGVAYDGSREADAALAEGERIAVAARGTLHIIGVLEPASWRGAGLPAVAGFAEPEAKARDRLDFALERAVAGVAPEVCALSILATGWPPLELARQATDLDLLVTGSRGYGPSGRASLGSVSTALLRSLPCPVLVVPRPAVDEPEGNQAQLSLATVRGRGRRACEPPAGYRSPART